MPSFGPDNQEIHGGPVTLVPLGTRTADGTGAAVSSREGTTLRLALEVTEASGSSTVTVEQSGDGAAWTAHSSFDAVTATGTTRKVFAGIDRYVRATWTITGSSASFRFSVDGELV